MYEIRDVAKAMCRHTFKQVVIKILTNKFKNQFMSTPHIANLHDKKAYWMVDTLWVILAEGKDTDNNFSLMWQLGNKGSGPGPHFHDQDEAFFVIDGEITYMANDEILTAKAGSFVWIPRGTVHAFKVESETVTVLNMYTPAGFEQAIITGGTPSEAFTVPPKDFKYINRMKAVGELFSKIGMHVVNAPDKLRSSTENNMDGM